MFEWSDTDLMVRDAVRQFIDMRSASAPRRIGNR